MRICRMRRASEGRRGVAIVIVLGLIAVLMMMAVAFSIHMRIERTGASNYRYGVQARHMVWSGVANAVRDLDGIMQSGGQPLMYPNWAVATSTGGSKEASVLSRTAADYIPAHLREEARTNTAYWSYITDDSGIVRGRYAFVIINSSGLLDANRVGGDPRGGGTNTYEIQIDDLSCISNPTEFINKAGSDGRYETFPELVNVNQRVVNNPAITNSLSVFSLSPSKKHYDIGGENGERVQLDVDSSSWVKAKVVKALTDSGIRPAYTDRVYRNMKDYVDPDSEPQPGALADACGEAVPMVNEVCIEYEIGPDGANYYVGCSLDVEWFYPFYEAADQGYTMKVVASYIGEAGNSHAALVPLTATKSFPISAPGSHSLGLANILDERNTGVSVTNALSVDYRLEVKIEIRDSAGNLVDAAPYPAGNGLKLDVTIPSIAAGATTNVKVWAEAVDPRFNFAVADPVSGSDLWVFSKDIAGAGMPGLVESPSLGAENNISKFYLSNPPEYPGNFDTGPDGQWASVANKNFTRVGELGSICIAPWTTIRLFDRKFPSMYLGAKPVHKVFDYFKVGSNDYARGLVNINSMNEEVLEALFRRCPENEMDGGSPLVDNADVQNLAWDIIDNGPYTNLSELCDGRFSWTNGISYDRDLLLESRIRNSFGLITARGNLFTAIIRADSFSSGMGGDLGQGMALATSRAIVEIWRDPIPDENGNHRSLIRYFRYLED